MRNKLDSLQILRGLAALSVVLFHYRFYMVPDKADMTLPDKLFGWGAIGVDLFFVISGFIMVYITYKKPAGLKTWKEFILGRILRILPTYYIILLVTFLISGAMSIFHYPDKAANLISALTFTTYLTSPAPFYINPDGMYNIRWTLNYEFYFYLAFSICIILGRKVSPLIGWVLLTSLSGYMITGTIIFSARGYDTKSISINFLTNPIIFEFLIGVISAYVYLYLKDTSKSFKLIFLLVSACAIFMLFPNIKPHSLYTAVISALLIVIVTLFNEPISSFAPKIFVKMGDVSFSWYLIHNPFIHAVADRIEHIAPKIVRSGYGFIFFTIASFLVACFSHKYLEVSLTNKIKYRVFNKSKTVTTGAA